MSLSLPPPRFLARTSRSVARILAHAVQTVDARLPVSSQQADWRRFRRGRASVLSARRRTARDHPRRVQQVRLAGRVFARRANRLSWCGLRDAQPPGSSRRAELSTARITMESLRRALRRADRSMTEDVTRSSKRVE